MKARNANDILFRANLTRATQAQLGDKCNWPGVKTDAEWAAALTTITAQRDDLAAKRRALTMARVNADEDLDELHQMMVQGLGMARARYRQNEGVLQTLSLLEARGASRQDILDEARDWSAAWRQLPDADWRPTTGNTPETFEAQRQKAQNSFDALGAATSAERKVRGEFNHGLGHVWQDCVEWYMNACLVFPEDTPEGELVRAIITRHAPPEEGDEPAPTPPKADPDLKLPEK